MIKPNKSEKIIMYSKDVSSLPNFLTSKNILPLIEDDQIYPRVFPTTAIPLKIALARRVKSFQEFDLNNTLA